MNRKSDSLLAELQRTSDRNAFVMMRYREEQHFKLIESSIRHSLKNFGLIARFAKDSALVDGLWDNIVLYMRHSRFGVVVFEDIDEREFNPNVSLELGYMYALGRRCLVLKERRMPLRPTDICGKLYRNFDVLALPDSISEQIEQWCENDLALIRADSTPSHPDNDLLKVVYDSSSEDPEFRSWGVFATDLQFDRHIQLSQADESTAKLGLDWYVDLVASGPESIGINKALQPLRGRVSFEYKAISSDAKNPNLLFCMIPMRGKPQELLEVGAVRSAEPANAYSPYRARYFVPENQVGDGAWHEARFEFDFCDLPEAEYSVFGPRVNEGCPRPGAGRILFRKLELTVPADDDVTGALI